MIRRRFLHFPDTAFLPSIGLCLLLFAVFCRPAFPQTLRIGGAGTDLGTMRLLAESFTAGNPGITVKVIPKSDMATTSRDLTAGDIQLAVSPRLPSAEEIQAGITHHPYARTALVFATKADLPLSAISVPTLKALYNGRQTSWSNGRPVRLILQRQNAAATDILVRRFPELWQPMKAAYARSSTTIAASSQDTASRLERLEGSIGVISLSSILGEKRALKPLSLNGVSPTPASIADGRYPIIMTLYFFLTPEKTSETSLKAAREFVGFVDSPKGRLILGNTGHEVLP